MKKIYSLFVLLMLSFSTQASVVLFDGDSYSASFTMHSEADAIKFSDAFWDVVVGIYDEDNSPFSATNATSTVTLTLFENTDGTNQVFSATQDTSFWLSDYGVFFVGFDSLFTDHDGSFSVTYNGPNSAVLADITIKNFSGILAPSNIAVANIVPTVSAVPVPAAAWLFISGLVGLVGITRIRREE